MNKFFSLAIAGLAAASVSHAALADGGAKFLGNITTSSQIRSDMGTYWNQITNENGCKWGSIHSVDANGKSVFNFNGFDSCENGYKWAKAAPGRTFKFHALIWGSQKPNFLCTKKNPGITKEKTKQYIEEWFDAVAAKFPDLEYIDVVNEAIWSGDPYNGNYHSGYSKPAAGAEGISTDDPECGGTYIVQALGGDDVINGKHQYNFVKKAFEMARERWPEAKLIYNDYNTLSWQMNEGIEMVQTLLKNGAPIDFYGQQSHDCKGMSKADFESKMTKIHDAVGIPLLVSEYDIGEADDQKQKNDYANQIPFMWETPWVGGITIWGYINGATWAANTGIMEKDGRKRAAMVWLEDYFAKNLDKGQNNTAVPVEPEPQTPFKGSPLTIPGKIQMEDFDIPGKGRGNDSYSDKDTENHGDSDYRKGTGVDLYAKSGDRIVVGYNQAGEWLEYTVNVKETGSYTMYAAVASSGGSAFSLSMDDKPITEILEVPAAAAVPEGEQNFDDYNKVKANVNLTAGEHILRFTVEKDWLDVDYINFVAGENAPDTDPIEKDEPVADDSTAIGKTIKMGVDRVSDYDVFDMQGAFMGRLSAYGMEQAVSTVKNNGINMAKGLYIVRERFTGNMQEVRVTK
ncbi:MAG: cellulase family glycosylhydrolase [Fibrobacter sp.]|nr:cellulase family glycosylhydrolase [Fibrobacter sp.]